MPFELEKSPHAQSDPSFRYTILRTKGDLCLEFLPASSFDLVTSFCTSSSRLFTRRSCIQSESVEFDDKVSSSHEVCSSSRYGAVNFSGTIKGVSDQVSGGFCLIRPGRASAENMGDDSLYYPHQGLYLMGQPEEGLRSNRLGSSVIRGVSPGSVILRHGALLLAPNVGVTPQRRMMNHPDEVSRVRKLASVV
ncbi:hypothetical protein BHE74_00052318 [Ensete ventricosum]|nr:hypothetical protein BHE74_00052318 [Ensete ventricosum]